ncbi:twitching motility protein PilT [Alphaproteobacteria bacterium]|nr:twitching motility protein PilT [Alphaproteobacteria bacterium]
MTDILLDTHIFLWLMNGDSKLAQENLSKIDSVINSEGRICLSAISIWEIAMLEAKRRIALTQPIRKWVEQAIEIAFVKVMELSTEILLDSCHLPGEFHSDPADRMIVATSRVKNIPLITQDEKILNYSHCMTGANVTLDSLTFCK